jgi:16S rRNA (cytidine1402-2'-O)-methyltransferase
MPGTLFVVATPIGNLEDLTFRALRTLREVDLIAAEDTRRTSKLLAHYDIRKPLLSYREHSEARETPRLLARLAAGESVALVSDAGTPAIADPGARLVAAAHDAGILVVPIPGASAVTTALSVSGQSGDQFVFMGFPPATGQARVRWFEALASESRPVVFFEAPHRIKRLSTEIDKYLSNNIIYVFRELTKIHEFLVIKHKQRSLDELPEKGEFVVVVEPSGSVPGEVIVDPVIATSIVEALQAGGFGREQSSSLAARALGVDGRALRKMVKKHKISIKQHN